MSESLAKEEEQINKNIQMTYYFTVLFVAIGIALVFYVLYQKTEQINIFMILLATSGGGIPIGFIGVFIDYKVSEYRVEKRSVEQ